MSSSSNCEASEEATGDGQSPQPSTGRHVGVEGAEDEAGAAAGMEGAAPPAATHGAAASPGGASEAVTVGAADPQVATGDASSCQGPANSEQNHPENLSSEDKKEPSLNDSCAVSSVALGIPSLATPQSVNKVTKNEDLPGSSASTGDNFSSDKSSEVMDKSSQEEDVTGSSSLSLEHTSKSQGVECGSDGAGSGHQEISKLLADEKNVADKGSVDIQQNEKGTTSGEAAADVRVKPEFVPTSSTDSDDEKQSIYQVKWIKHKGTTMPIITQNENGPCPLLAIMNLLLLQSKIKLPSGAEVVTSNELMAYLADWIFEHVPKNISEDTRLNYEQNMHDAIAVFPRLQTGLDVNVRFTGVSQFEYTPECIVFDLLDIPLYHGWLVDPQMPDLVSAIGNRTYNQLVEKIIVQKNSNKEELIAEALLAEEFLTVTASQLTYHGLSELSATTKEDEMCVLFRNNHFSTLYKHKNELFVLVTDQGFLRESNVVWETLSNIEGDGHFVDSDFRTYRLPETAAATSLPTPSFPINSKEQIDHDYLVALSLEQEQSELQPGATWSASAASATLSDHELALRLQEEENLSAESASKQQQPTPRQQKPDAQTTTVSNLSATGSSSSNSCVPAKEKKESSCLLM